MLGLEAILASVIVGLQETFISGIVGFIAALFSSVLPDLFPPA